MMKRIPKILKNLLDYEIDPAFRERALLIFKEIIKTKPKKILDAGCGRGFYIKSLSYLPFIEKIYGIDINSAYLQIAKKNIDKKKVVVKKASVYKLPFPDNSFDLVIASEILEHLKDDFRALLELRRVLKTNRKLIITVPNLHFPFLWDPINYLLMKFFKTHVNKNIWWLAGIWADHERLYSLEKIKKLISDSGFRIKTIKQIVHFCLPFSHFLIYGLGKNIVEKFNLQSFNRFNLEKKTYLVKIVAKLFRLPNLIAKKNINKYSSSVGIFLVAEKK